MQLLNFDEINKYVAFREWLISLEPSEVMEQKRKICDDLWELLEYLYIYGFVTAREELGVIAEDVESVLPTDYKDAMDESIYRKFDGLDFADRTLSYAELGDKESIIRVAETDGHRVYNDGGYQGAKSAGARTKTWLTMLDDKVRDTHDYLEGMTVGIDKRFYTFDGDSARYPGDFALPQNNINCRCEVAYNR